MSRFLTLAAFTAVLCLSGTGKSLAQENCTPAARFQGQVICAEWLGAPPPAANLETLDSAQQAEIIGKTQAGRPANLKNAIWELALVRKFGEEAITPTEEEIEYYRVKFNEAMARGYESEKKAVAFIHELLAKNKYRPPDEAKIRTILSSVQLSMKFYEDRKNHRTNLPEEYQFIAREAETKIAAMMMKAWKTDKALHKAYGGKLIRVSTGLFPVDAYAALTRYILTEGELEILDPAYESVRTEFEEELASPTGGLEPDPEVAAHYYERPDAQIEMNNPANNFDKLKAELEFVLTADELERPKRN